MEKILGEREKRRKQMKDLGLLHNTFQPLVSIAERNSMADQVSTIEQKPPLGWLDCPPQSKPIGFFVASKTPLSSAYDSHIPQNQRYSPHQSLKLAESVGMKITMVIDLTNTSRYYDPVVFEREDIRYVKIQCRGRDGPPDSCAISKFIYTVQSHRAIIGLEGYSNDYKSGILVHCTHGFNRTGSMIVHYLQRSEQWPDLNKHILIFSECRPPGIYKHKYLAKLYESYLEIKRDSLVFPDIPSWKHSAFAPPVSVSKTTDLFCGQKFSRVQAYFSPEKYTYPVPLRYSGIKFSKLKTSLAELDDVLGEEVCDEQVLEVQKLCIWVCFNGKSSAGATKNKLSFPGSQPVSLSNANIHMIREQKYSVTWKADGVRYLLLILRDGTYLIDRKFAIRRIQMRFPLSGQDINKTHHITLLDGEMVLDFDPESKLMIRRYLAYDCMAFNGELLADKPFLYRLQMLNSEVIEPRKRFFSKMQKSNYYDIERELFTIRQKKFYPLSSTRALLESFIPNLCHESDGLIFQPQSSKYEPNTVDTLLKWKFPKMNSVDFFLKFEEIASNAMEPMLYVGGKEGKLIRINDKISSYTTDLMKLDGKIVECSWDFRSKEWVYMRTRLDKISPNFVTVYENTVLSINDNITSEDILRLAELCS